MSCERFDDDLKAHALGAEIADETAVHVATCARCQAKLDGERSMAARMDSDLAHALSIEPSADFVARVRTRVASEPPRVRLWPASWGAAWAAAGAAAAVVLALLAVSVLRRDGAIDRAPAGTQATRTTTAPAPAPGSGSPGLQAPDSAIAVGPRIDARAPVARAFRPGAGARTTRPPAVRATEPEVLVPPGQEEAIRRFAAAVSSGRIDASSLIANGSESEPGSSDIRKLDIQPITIAPLTVPVKEVEAPGPGTAGDIGRSES